MHDKILATLEGLRNEIREELQKSPLFQSLIAIERSIAEIRDACSTSENLQAGGASPVRTGSPPSARRGEKPNQVLILFLSRFGQARSVGLCEAQLLDGHRCS